MSTIGALHEHVLRDGTRYSDCGSLSSVSPTLFSFRGRTPSGHNMRLNVKYRERRNRNGDLWARARVDARIRPVGWPTCEMCGDAL